MVLSNITWRPGVRVESDYMKVLCACEESQKVCIAFRRLGNIAFSCDLLEPSGNRPEWHIQGNVLDIMNGNCSFVTMDNTKHYIDKWDMIIAFPPCTDLAVSGASWFEQKREDGRQRKSIEFFAKFLEVKCDKVVIENPIGIISGNYIKEWFPDLATKYSLPIRPTQIIQPWQFGDGAVKSTCLWLKGVDLLEPKIRKKPEIEYIEWIDKKTGKKKRQAKWYFDALSLKLEERRKVRSKTFDGIANAMAEQWGKAGV